MKQTVKKNKRLSLTLNGFLTVISLVSSGTLMQTFLATLGMDIRLIHIHTTLIQVSNVITLLVSSGITGSDRAIKKYALTSIPSAILFLCYIPFCRQSGDPGTSFVFLALISVFHAVVHSLRTVYNYSIPYLIYPAEDYGTFSAMIGILAGTVSLALGYIISWLTERIPFVHLMCGAFLLAGILELLSVWFALQQKSILPGNTAVAATGTRKHVSVKALLTHATFLPLIPTTLLRGFASGTVVALATLAFNLGYNESVTTAMVSVQSLTTLASCAVIGVILKHMSARIPVLIGSLIFLAMPLMFMGSSTVFLVAYALIFFGKTMVDYGVPALLRNIVPLEIAGPYNVWRMTLHNAGSVLATSLAAVLEPEMLVALTVISSVLSGCGFFFTKVLQTRKDTLA